MAALLKVPSDISRDATQVIGDEEMRPDERLKTLIETIIRDQTWTVYDQSPEDWSAFFHLLLESATKVCKIIKK